MLSWKISRINIISFKAFKRLDLKLDSSSLITLDGPNGYGKTSVFDAIELLLTGRIDRISSLFETLFKRNKMKYEDSLLWNNRSGDEDLSIKIEFTNDERSLVLARYAPVEAFKIKANNRADRFDHFSLYELDDFESLEFNASNRRDEDFLDTIFGDNFRTNFSFLNYLQQGQSKFLHTQVEDRKDQLGSLLKINEVSSEIERCKSISSRIGVTYFSEKRRTQETALSAEISHLRSMLDGESVGIEYKRISTTKSVPGWDVEEPFPIYSKEIHNKFQDSIRDLSDLFPKKNAVRIRAENEKIEADIRQNAETLRLLVQVGNDMYRLDHLNNLSDEIRRLAAALVVVKNGASVITSRQARSLPGWQPNRLEWFEEQISVRNDLQAEITAHSSAAAELFRLKEGLLVEHAVLYESDKSCPLCGQMWESHTAMVAAIAERTEKINSELDQDGQALVSLIASMTHELAIIESQIAEQEAVLRVQFNEPLHQFLLVNKTRLPAIQQLAERLLVQGFAIQFEFNVEMPVVDGRLAELVELIRSKRTAETVALPENWRQIIMTVFKNMEDFYILDSRDLENKMVYLDSNANLSQNRRLQSCLQDLGNLQRENKAALNVKDRIDNLREVLIKTERNYSDNTIAEIELIFHIYSGRLIQNYQRGLGLFIESQKGKQLRFLTAEKSEHDALMSMSAGQISSLSLAFFLALNKVYSNVPLILIDDPYQSLDEVNIASLTDLLRCELSDRQLIVSSHEEDTSAYMRYRFNRAGLTSNSFSMQRLAREEP